MAVKKLESVSQCEKQFRAEVGAIGTIQHVNLVRLLGLCREGAKQLLLVYEYLHLFKADESKVLGWGTRYQIALGIDGGVQGLHHSLTMMRGYLAPEWLTGVAITAKADVYSYGMLLFELVKHG